MAVSFLATPADAARALRAGHLVVYPTETSYALGADLENAAAIAALFALKRRSRRAPLTLVAATLSMAERYVRFNAPARALAIRYWPGPLTLVLPARSAALARRLGSRDGTIGIRVSSHRTARAVAHALGRPVTATSANVSGQGDCYSTGALVRAFGNSAVPISVLSAGRLPRRRPSTIARVTVQGITLLRQGSLRLSASVSV